MNDISVTRGDERHSFNVVDMANASLSASRAATQPPRRRRIPVQFVWHNGMSYSMRERAYMMHRTDVHGPGASRLQLKLKSLMSVSPFLLFLKPIAKADLTQWIRSHHSLQVCRSRPQHPQRPICRKFQVVQPTTNVPYHKAVVSVSNPAVNMPKLIERRHHPPG